MSNKPKNSRGIGAVRYVHSKRARVLRRRGEDVRHWGFTGAGSQRFVWFPKR